jgi:hypothetical protein
VRNNPILGYVTCNECGLRASVHQQVRGAGRLLYTRGCDCKYRNSPGTVFQARLWRESEWLEGAAPQPGHLDVAKSTDAAFSPEGSETRARSSSAKRWVVASLGIAFAVVMRELVRRAR